MDLEPSAPEATRRKKLLFRAWRRGFRELDLLVGSFAERHLGGFDARQLDLFERLLDAPDQHLYDWIAGRAPVPAALDGDVTRLLMNFRYQERGRA